MTISLAQQWELQELSLQVFDIDELTSDFRCIRTFKDVCEGFDIKYSFSYVDRLNRTLSRSTSAMFKLNIISQGLTRGSSFYYPTNPFITKNSSYFNAALKSGNNRQD